MSEEFVTNELMQDLSLTNEAIIVWSCTARQCHPETCCCDENEAAIMDYKDYGDKSGRQYFGVVMYGDRDELEVILEASKNKKSLTFTKRTSIIIT